MADGALRSHFDACNRGDVVDIASHFRADAMAFDADYPPARGPQRLLRCDG